MSNNEELIPVEVDSKDVEQITSRAITLADSYEGFIVTDAVGFTDAAVDLILIKEQLTQVNDKRMSITRPMDESKKAIIAFFKPVVLRLEQSERRIKKAMGEWKREEDRKVREAQRLEQERARKREEKLRQEAEEKREAGQEARADILEDRAEAATPAPLAPAAPKVEGISTRKVWKFEVVDPKQVPDEYKTIDTTKIGAVVRALKNGANIPGVRVWAEEVISARSS